MEESLNLRFRDSLTSRSGVTYVNLRLLGTGGNAETYLMVSTSAPHRGHVFAVKLFRRLSKPEWIESFLQEIAFLRTCSHPSVMRIFDEGQYRDQHPFLVAEYLPQTLKDVIRKKSCVVDKLSYALQLLSALDYLAEPVRSVVHRDVKPENIFLKGGSCVLGDFGLVKRAATGTVDREMLKESLGPGMPRFYRTPDLVEYLKGGQGPTPKSDVFQLGLVLTELFTRKNPLQAIRGSNFTSPIRLKELRPIADELDAPIRNLLSAMLTVDPIDRPAAVEIAPAWLDLFLAASGRDAPSIYKAIQPDSESAGHRHGPSPTRDSLRGFQRWD
jgi:serine/threonine protein kinase